LSADKKADKRNPSMLAQTQKLFRNRPHNLVHTVESENSWKEESRKWFCQLKKIYEVGEQ
jgi:hypothetical protein